MTEKEIQELSARLINAQEEERSRLAREMHDDVSQQVAALSLGLSNPKRAIPPESREAQAQSERIREKVVHLGESVRRLSHGLHPAVLWYSGLDAAIRQYCGEIGVLTGLRATFRCEGSFKGLSPALSVCAYRVTQEALGNVARHAQTDRAEVELTRSGSTIKLKISDAGAGMDLTAARAAGGPGLTSMRERARLVNGNVQVQSTPGVGTTVTLTLQAEGESTDGLHESAGKAFAPK